MNTNARSKTQNVNVVSVLAGTIMVAGLLLGLPLLADSAVTMISAQAGKTAQALDLVPGKSTVVDVPVAIKRASLADPAPGYAFRPEPRALAWNFRPTEVDPTATASK